VVEGSLVIALVAFGGGQISTVAAVLLYRIVSFWGFLPVGWVFWGGLTWRNRRADQAAARATEVPVARTSAVPPPEWTAELEG
jgi:Na+/proline symporter